MKKNFVKILFFGILLLAFVLRLYRLQFPLADWHSWRQADTSSVSRNFVKTGFNLLHPKFDDLSNVASGFENPEGLRFVEFPIFNAAHALLFKLKLFPFLSFEATGRLTSVLLSIWSGVFLYLIVLMFLGQATALWALFFWAVLPYNIYFNRVILPEPMMVFAALGGLYFLSVWVENGAQLSFRKSSVLVLGIIFGATALLLKPFSLVYFLPLVYLAARKRFNLTRWFLLFFCFFLILLPFVLWRKWIAQFPEGIPAFQPLLNETGIRFKGAFFRWIFGERIAKLILGFWGVVPLAIGLMVKPAKKEGLFFYSLLSGVLFYLFFVAGGNVRHDYYQIITVPVICIFLGKGASFLTRPPEVLNKLLSWMVLTVSILFMVGFSWYQVRDFFNINNQSIVEAGMAVDKLLPNDAKVIAPYGGDTAFLYQTNRKGWPVGIEIEKMIKLGAEYYVNTNFGPETDWLKNTYCTLVETKEYIIIDLTKKCQ